MERYLGDSLWVFLRDYEMSSKIYSPLCLPSALGDGKRGYINLNISYKMDVCGRITGVLIGREMPCWLNVNLGKYIFN